MRELFSRFVAPIIDKVLGIRCTSFGYQYSEIVGALASVYFCGGDCVEDVTSHLMPIPDFAGQRQHKTPVMLDGVRGRWA